MYLGKPLKEVGNDVCGFVYIVYCTHPDEPRRYVGYKLCWSNFGKKTKQKESNWKYYTTSSKFVNDAIKKLGLIYFRFEVIQLFKTRGGVRAAEAKLQWHLDVLTDKHPDDTPKYWNRQIGAVKWIPQETLSEEAIMNHREIERILDEDRETQFEQRKRRADRTERERKEKLQHNARRKFLQGKKQ
jgi:hypothetical protein